MGGTSTSVRPYVNTTTHVNTTHMVATTYTRTLPPRGHRPCVGTLYVHIECAHRVRAHRGNESGYIHTAYPEWHLRQAYSAETCRYTFPAEIPSPQGAT